MPTIQPTPVQEDARLPKSDDLKLRWDSFSETQEPALALEENSQHDREIKRASVVATIYSNVPDFGLVWPVQLEHQSSLLRVTA